ncbi:hypothetical protein KEM54_000436 [Ascosphaera aggregata]|nr:hypothetical protein KEM54_000436 [Ascosphaera aggregata]
MASKPSLSWISTLKLKELQSLATAIGVASSGTKSVLSERIKSTLCSYQRNHAEAEAEGREMEMRGCKERPLSLLSIDMGIRNLAFAHVVKRRNGGRRDVDGGNHHSSSRPSTIILSAWNRIDVSLLGNEDGGVFEGIDSVWRPSTSQMNKKEKQKQKEKEKKDQEKEEEIEEKTTAATTGVSKKHAITLATDEAEGVIEPSLQSCNEGKESFAPEKYARIAYSLMTSLIAKYNPSHIIIERQRFRSAGGSAVQEWSIRVGMFEAMLYATVHTLQMREREKKNEVMTRRIDIQGIDPKKVASYWIERNPWALDKSDRGGKKSATARATKKAKIDILMEWLSREREGEGESRERGRRMTTMSTSMIKLGKNELKCEKSRKRRMKKETTTTTTTTTSMAPVSATDRLIELDKLDDLADCVLQGIAWLEWERLRGQLAMEGEERSGWEMFRKNEGMECTG